MLEKLFFILFVLFCFFVTQAYQESEVVVHECNKPKLTPYFVGSSTNFKILKGKVKYMKESECTSQTMTRREWSKVKNAFKSTRGVQ